MTVKYTTACPAGGDCGGTGWVWRMASPSGEPEPDGYVRCECNPHAAGQPDALLRYECVDGRWIGQRRMATVTQEVLDDMPF